MTVKAELFYRDKYGSEIPLCTSCYTEVREESFAPNAGREDE